MGKTAPDELWRKHVLERFEAFRQSGELEKLRKEGLAVCGRKKRFMGLEWARSPIRERYSSPLYMEWHHKCEAIAKKFGLAPHTVVCACLISGYKPDKAELVIESEWPRIRLITDITDDQFLARLSYEAQLRGLYVISRQGSVEITRLFLNPIPIMYMEPPPLPSSMPPQASTFYMRVETPVGYPPEAARKLHKDASQLEKDILTALGYSIPKRLRTSSLVSEADKLKVTEGRLQSRGLYEIVADTFDEGSVNEDEKRRKTLKTQRHRLRKRLVKPYEA